MRYAFSQHTIFQIQFKGLIYFSPKCEHTTNFAEEVHILKFYAGRFSLVPANQNLFYQLGSEQKFIYALEALHHECEFNHNGLSLLLEPILDTHNNVIGGKLGRQTSKTLPLKDDGKLIKRRAILYPYILFILVPEEQIILFQRDRTVFSSDLQVFRHLEYFFELQLLEKGLEVSIKPLTAKGKFWDAITTSEKIYNIRFVLEMPNFLGSTEKHLRDTLKEIRNLTNGTKLDIAVNNKNGELKLGPDKTIQPMVNWSENGAGEWTVRRKAKGHKKPTTIKNSDQLATFEYDNDIDTTDEAAIKDIYSHIDLGSYKVKK